MGSIRIPLHSSKYPGLFTIVDEEDAPAALAFRWGVSIPKSGSIYAFSTYRDEFGKAHGRYLHRHLLAVGDEFDVDHINGDGLDNRRSNLRIVTRSENQMNKVRQRNNTSGFKGVSWHKQRGQWRAYIKFRGKSKHLGLYDDPRAAAYAYDAAARHLFGKYACLNFPENNERSALREFSCSHKSSVRHQNGSRAIMEGDVDLGDLRTISARPGAIYDVQEGTA